MTKDFFGPLVLLNVTPPPTEEEKKQFQAHKEACLQLETFATNTVLEWFDELQTEFSYPQFLGKKDKTYFIQWSKDHNIDLCKCKLCFFL